MKWFRENRFFGVFLVVTGVCTCGSGAFLVSAKNGRDVTARQFREVAEELNRLERLSPYPSGENLRKMKVQADDYATALALLNSELKGRVIPLPSMAPNQFQSRLRLAIAGVAGKARASKVKLPDKFYLGFDEFAAALPNEEAAPLLGQELAQIEWVLDTLFEAPVDALTSFRRTPLPEEQGPASPPSPASGPASRNPGTALLARNVIEATFVSTPGTARKVLNQIVGANRQFFIVRLLHVRNEKDKGPPREVTGDTAGVMGSVSPSGSTHPTGPRSSTVMPLNFIVGTERIETTAKIEIVRFMF